jgi:hypothetical protein
VPKGTPGSLERLQKHGSFLQRVKGVLLSVMFAFWGRFSPKFGTHGLL